MKKTFPVNINGKIFYIDEDAYSLLQSYLSQLRATFPGEEGSEIVTDIESRISELFDERIALGANVIVIDDVRLVIETMGRPEELSEESSYDDPTTQQATNDGTVPPATPGSFPPPPPIHKRLYRDVRHKVFGGVIAGLGQYLGWDVTVMRIFAVVITLCTYFWPCVIIYLIAWMIIPVARTPRQILEMQGQPVTLDNVGQTVINNANPPTAPIPNESNSSFSNFLNTFFSVAAKGILGFIGFFSGICAVVMAIFSLVIIAGICTYYFAGNYGLLDAMDLFDTASPYLESWGIVCVLLAVFIPAFALSWAGCAVLFKVRGASAPMVLTAIIFEIIFIIAAAVLLNLNDASETISYIVAAGPATIIPPMLS